MNEQQRELITACHDRELDAAGMQAAQALLQDSEDARAFAQELRDCDAALHNAFDPILKEPVPAAMLAVATAKRRRRVADYAWPMALAASVGVVAVLVGREMGSDEAMQQQIMQMQQQIAQLRYQTLENTPSGTPAAWVAPTGKVRAEVTPLKTYRTADNRFCREYEERVEDEHGVEVRRGIACRAGKSLWPDRLAAPDQAGGAGGQAGGVNL